MARCGRRIKAILRSSSVARTRFRIRERSALRFPADVREAEEEVECPGAVQERCATIYRELLRRGLSATAAKKIADNSRRWWKNSGMTINIAFPIRDFDGFGLPRLAA